MQPITATDSHAVLQAHNPDKVQPLSPAEELSGTEAPPEPDRDKFLHEKVVSPGRYWIEAGPDGPDVRFEAPTGRAHGTEPPPHAEPEDRTEETTCNTDQVDQELRALRSRAQSLEQQVRSAGAGEEQSETEKELAAVKRELARKDNDAYRRAHARFS